MGAFHQVSRGILWVVTSSLPRCAQHMLVLDSPSSASSLLRANILGNWPSATWAKLEALKRQTDAPPESTTSEIWSLLQLEYSREQLFSALALFKDIPGSSTSQHVLKAHERHCRERVMSRSFIHMVREFFSVSDTDTAREALERRVAFLEAKKPCKVTARCASRSCLGGPRDGGQLATPGSPRKDGSDFQRTLMSKRGARFMLPREHMIDLEVWAVAASDARATQLAEGLAHAQLALDLFLARRKGAALAGDARPRMLLSSVRLGEEEKAHWEDLFSTYGPRSSRATD